MSIGHNGRQWLATVTWRTGLAGENNHCFLCTMTLLAEISAIIVIVGQFRNVNPIADVLLPIYTLCVVVLCVSYLRSLKKKVPEEDFLLKIVQENLKKKQLEGSKLKEDSAEHIVNLPDLRAMRRANFHGA